MRILDLAELNAEQLVAQGDGEFAGAAIRDGHVELLGLETANRGDDGCGTAAIITPIGRFKSEKFDVTVADGGSGEFTVALRNQLLGIQLGEIEDPHNWMWKVC